MAGLKLREIAQGTEAVKTVDLALVNAAQPGQATPTESVRLIKVGVRVLTGDETLDVLDKAQTAAAANGVSKWDPEHPICRLHEMVQTLALCVISVDQETGLPENPATPEPFFDAAEHVLSSRLIGADNIVYLHTEAIKHQDQMSPLRMQKVTFDDAVAAIVADMDRKEGEEGPLVRMSHATLVSCLRILGRQLYILLVAKSPSTEPAGGGTGETSKNPLTRSDSGPSSPSKTMIKAATARNAKKRARKGERR